MKHHIVTQAIVLSRTDYGEADRILTLLTPHQGKVRVLAKGVRRVKSKLAGGIELFSVSTITFAPGRGALGTLIATRLDVHYGTIVQDIDRTMLGYELMKQLHRFTEDEPETAYFELLRDALQALNNAAISLTIIRFWFSAQLIALSGQTPNLYTDISGEKLHANKTYDFDLGAMAFAPSVSGRFAAEHIKVLRLVFAASDPRAVSRVNGVEKIISTTGGLVRAMLQNI